MTTKKKTKTTKKRRISKNRPLHRRIALHPVSILVLLCVGVFLVGLTFHSSADSYTIDAQVLAPLPTQPAVITSPLNQAHFTTRPIVVSGTCPEQSYVILNRNGIFSGSAICSVGQTTFQIETDLSLGSNVLNAQVYNVTDQAGPSSPSVTVWYSNPPSPSGQSPSVASTTTPSQIINPNSPPFFITANFNYQPHFIYQPFNLSLALHGGVAPFALTIAWGDGTNSTFVRHDDSEFSATHTYNGIAKSEQTDLVKLQAVDSQGSTAYLEVAELVCAQTCPTAAPTVTDTASPLITSARQWTRFMWPAYLIVLLMVISFWLGERQEYHNLLTHR